MNKPPRLHQLRPRVATLDIRRVKTPEKIVDEIYLTPEYRRWREQVLDLAGRRCVAILDTGKRCWRREPAYRMYADHVIELKDGGAPFDVANGQCLCGSHHTSKTIAARTARQTLLQG